MSNYQHERGWLDSEVWGNAPYSEREAWSWLIGEANWKDGIRNISGAPIQLKRGQLTSSVRFMAQRFQWSVGKVQRFLRKLRSWNMIETSTATDTAQTVITICNYSIYQNKLGKSDTETDTATDTDMGTGAGTAPIQGRVQTRNPSIPSSQYNIVDANLENPKKTTIIKKPDDVSNQVWNDFNNLREAKKAPVTETVISRMRQEAQKINWTLEQAIIETCAQGWQGFKADYVRNRNSNQKSNQKSGGLNAKDRIARETAELLEQIRQREGD